MDLVQNLLLGFEVALSFQNLLMCTVGVSIGMAVSVLPGIGTMAAIAMLLPVTFYMDPLTALIMLAGIYYGAQYGGSTASILLNLPGTATAAMTCLDGYPMSKQGRAGPALFITSVASFFGSTVGIVLIATFAPPLANVALHFRPEDYFSMMFLGLVAAATMSVGSPLKGIVMVVVGLCLGLVGTDIHTATERYAFGVPELTDGLSFVALAIGLFGISEIISSIRSSGAIPVGTITWRKLLPTGDEMRRSLKPMMRGSAVGAGFGILPGAGATIASFVSYALEKRLSKTPERFGHGAVEGVAAPESANNAAVQAAFIPTLTLGVPGDIVMAIMLGAFLIHGITPGPHLIAQEPSLFWGLIASFWLGNIILLLLNIPLIGVWVRILSIPSHILYPSILFFVCIGVYSLNNSPFDIPVALFFGAAGYLVLRSGYPVAPLLLGFILGPMMEVNLRRALTLSRGDFGTFIEYPVSLGFLLATLLVVAISIVSGAISRSRKRSKEQVVTGS